MKSWFIHSITALWLLLPVAVINAQGESEGATFINPLDSSISSIPALFQALLDILLIFAVPLVVFFIILAGFKYVTARGNTETIKQAHQALLYALIGGVLILGANVLLGIINETICSVTGSSPTNNCGN